jgi:hypothetical protein
MTIVVDCLPVTDLLAWASSSGEAVQNEDGQVRGSLLRHPNVTSGTLKAASEEILSEQLGSDYLLENDPAASRAHAYWRRASPHLSSEGHTRLPRRMCRFRARFGPVPVAEQGHPRLVARGHAAHVEGLRRGGRQRSGERSAWRRRRRLAA